MDIYNTLIIKNPLFKEISHDVFSNTWLLCNSVLSLSDTDDKIQLLKTLLTYNFNEVFPLLFGTRLSRDERNRLAKTIIIKFNSLIYIEDFLEWIEYSEKPHPEHFSQIKHSFIYLIKNNLVSKNTIDLLTHRNSKLLNLKFIWQEWLILGDRLADISKWELWRKQKQIYDDKTWFSMNLFLSYNIPEVIIVQLYDILRSFHHYLWWEGCKWLLSKIQFHNILAENNDLWLIIKFLKKLYRHIVMCWKSFICNDVDGILISIQDIKNLIKKIDDYDFLRFQSSIKQEIWFDIDKGHFLDLYWDNLDPILFLSARFISERELLTWKKLFYLIIKEISDWRFNKYELVQPIYSEILDNNYDRQIQLINDIEWRKRNVNLLTKSSNEEEIEKETLWITENMKEVFQKNIIKSWLLKEFLTNHINLVQSSEKDIEITKSCNVPRIKEYFWNSPWGKYSYVQNTIKCIGEEKDPVRLKKLILTFLTSHIFNWLCENSNLDKGLIWWVDFQEVIKFTKSVILPQKNEEFIFTAEISHPIGVFDLWSRESIRARNCLDYSYIDFRTVSILSFIIDPWIKVLYTWKLDQNNFDNIQDFNNFKTHFSNKINAKDLQFDQIKKSITIECWWRNIVIWLRDAVALKMLRIEKDKDWSLFLFTDNELYKDNESTSPYSRHMDEYIIDLSNNMRVRLLDANDIWEKFTIKQSASPWGTYSKYWNHICNDQEFTFNL